MIPLYLLDTNIISEPLKKDPNQNVIKKLEINNGRTAICAPVLHEMSFGVETLPFSKKRSLIMTYIEKIIIPTLPVLPYDSAAAIIHSKIRAELKVKGNMTGYVDSQIASISLANDLILVTRNVKDFSNIKGLKVENWFL